MKGLTVALVGVLVAPLFVSVAQAQPAARAVTCTTVRATYPAGLAASAAAARRWQREAGVRLPVNAKAYKRFARLDVDRDGVVCPRKTTSATSATSETTATLAPGDSGVLRPTSQCRVTAPGSRPVSLGSNRPDGRTPSRGIVNATVLFVDFPNAPATQTPQARYAEVVPGAVAFLESASHGRLRIQPSSQSAWLRMPRTTGEYDLARGLTFVQHKAYIADAVAAAGGTVDFSSTDVLIVIAPQTAPDLGISPAFTPFKGGGVTVGGRTIDNAVTIGTDFAGRQDRVLAHELLHTLGLVDLYAFDPALPLFGFTGPFSIMGDLTSSSPGPLAWERWLLGWVDDRQVACLGAGASTITLASVSRGDGVQAAVVPRPDGSVVVVEARSADGVDAGSVPGIVVYTIDPRVESGYGPVRVATGPGGRIAPLGSGESVTVSGLTVRVLDAASGRVEITVP